MATLHSQPTVNTKQGRASGAEAHVTERTLEHFYPDLSQDFSLLHAQQVRWE